MALAIVNNVSSLNAQHSLARSTGKMQTSLERLSTGLKINRGADGPAALVFSEKQRAQIAGLKTAISNSEKAVSLVQTAEGALNEINSLLVKVRSLALESANTGVNDDDALAANQAELANALDTINRIADTTQFGQKKLLDGSAGRSGATTNNNVDFLAATTDTVGGTYVVDNVTAGTRAMVAGTTAQAGNLAQDETISVNGVAITLNAGMSRSDVQNRINEFTGQTGVVAEDHTVADTTRLRQVTFGSTSTVSVVSNRSGAGSAGFTTSVQQAAGTDIAGDIGGVAASGSGNVLTATSGAAKGLKLQFAEDGTNLVNTVAGALGTVTVVNNSLTFQIGANQNQTATIAIDKLNPNSLGLGVANNQFNSLGEIDVTSASKAQDAIGVIDKAIDEVTKIRGTLGAFQANSLESMSNNLRTTLENTVNAESVIRDTDFAEEIANFTKQQVLMQAGTSVLSNANQIPQMVLSLLR